MRQHFLLWLMALVVVTFCCCHIVPITSITEALQVTVNADGSEYRLKKIQIHGYCASQLAKMAVQCKEVKMNLKSELAIRLAAEPNRAELRSALRWHFELIHERRGNAAALAPSRAPRRISNTPQKLTSTSAG